jgi:hypothetical protein
MESATTHVRRLQTAPGPQRAALQRLRKLEWARRVEVPAFPNGSRM